MSKLINCKVCGKEISANAQHCTSCGEKVKKPFYKKVGFWFIALLIIGIASSGGGEDSSSTVNNTTSTAPNTNNENVTEASTSVNSTNNKVEKKENLELTTEVEVETDGYIKYLVGVIKNNRSKEYSYVQVTINLYDADGNQIGTALDNINSLEPGGTWKFKAAMLENEDVASFKVAEISGF